MEPFYLQGLLLLVLLIVASDCQADSELVVSASPEDNIALPCGGFYQKDLQSSHRLRWSKCSTDTTQKKMILSWPETSQDAKRVKWGSDEKGTMSLILANVQKSDEGIYNCEICQGWNCTLRITSLRVKDCKVRPLVKVAPSMPIKLNCSVDMKGHEGPLSVSWALVKGGKSSPLVSERVEKSDTSLFIKSARVNDSAWYRCSYTDGQTRHCFDMKMLVQAEDVEVATFRQADMKEEKEGGGTFTAAVASVVTVAVVLAALTGAYIYWRRCTPRASQQPQWQSAGTPTERVCDYYETVTLTLSDDPSDQQINILYQGLEDDSPRTCRNLQSPLENISVGCLMWITRLP